MPGLVPGIHVLFSRWGKGVDGRDKPGHDGVDGLAPMTIDINNCSLKAATTAAGAG
jgi:hypothetical protein